MAEPIRISALGRDAQVGDLYNYFTDAIIPSWIDVPNGRKTISNTVGDPELLFLYQQPENCKLHLLGINSHLLQNMKRGSVPGHQLWFDFYLNTNSMDGDEEHAQVTLLFRVVRRTETLDLDLLRSKIDDYQIISADESATHVIDEVVYGAELICSMRKALDLSQETKESAEVSIYFAAKKYLDDTIGKSTNLELPAELDQVSCTVLSSIEPGKKNEMYFDSFNLYLQNLLNTGNNRQKWKPMEFRLQNMSVALIEAKLWSERKDDIALEKEHHQVSIKWISKEMLDISNDPSLKRFPLLETFICYFRNLLPRFWKGIDEAYETFEMLPEEKALEEMTYISDWLKRVMDLFACRRKDIREMCWLLKDTDLVLQDMQVIEAQMKIKDCKIAKLFVLNLEYKQVPIVNDIEELVGQQTSTAMLPVLPIFLYEKEQIGCIRSALSQFANEARLAKLSSAHGTSYYVGLESSMLENGAVKIVDYSGISPVIISEDNLVEYLQKKQKHQLAASSSSVSACLPPPLIPTAASYNRTTKSSIRRKEQIGSRAESDKPNLHFEKISLIETNVTEPSTSTENKSSGLNQTVNKSRMAQVPDILSGRSNLQQEKVIPHQKKCEGIIDRRGLRVDEIGVWNRMMLAEMDGRNLTSTREVIQRRQQLTQSLKDIENELETFLVKIEEIEKYRQQLKKYGHNMETNKHFAVERMEMYPVKVDCDSGFMAYNCLSCKKTCEMPSRPTSFKKRSCKDVSCRCAVSDHEFQPFTWTLAKVRRTRNEMEAQFESYANQKFTTEESMANCLNDLNIAKAKVLSLLEHIGDNARSLDSTALRSNALNPAEYLSLMRSRILEEQAPGYELRLQTLTDLQQSLNAPAKVSAEKGQSRDSNVTIQPVKSNNVSRGRATHLQTSATGTAGASNPNSGHPGKNSRDGTPSRSSQTSHINTSGGKVTAPANIRPSFT